MYTREEIKELLENNWSVKYLGETGRYFRGRIEDEFYVDEAIEEIEEMFNNAVQVDEDADIEEFVSAYVDILWNDGIINDAG